MSDKSIPLPVLLEVYAALKMVDQAPADGTLPHATWHACMTARLQLMQHLKLSVPVAEEVTE